jgi:hypothetical protein
MPEEEPNDELERLEEEPERLKEELELLEEREKLLLEWLELEPRLLEKLPPPRLPLLWLLPMLPLWLLLPLRELPKLVYGRLLSTPPRPTRLPPKLPLFERFSGLRSIVLPPGLRSIEPLFGRLSGRRLMPLLS